MSSDNDDVDLGGLKSAMTAATPPPDAATRTAHLALAQENFDKLHGARQESATASRLTSERPARGVLSGVRDMFNALTTKGGLTVTTAIVASGFLVLTPQGQDILGRAPGLGGDVGPSTELGTAAPDIDFGGTPERERSAADANLDRIVAAPARDDAADLGERPEMTDSAADQSALTEAAEADVGAGSEARVDPDAQTADADGRAEDVIELPSVVVDLAPAVVPGEVMRIAPAPSPTAPLGGVLSADAPLPGYDDMAAAPATTVPTDDTIARTVAPDTEAFANEAPNPLHIVAEEPVSTFSIDVDTAAYSVIRQSLNAGHLPPRDAVRIEEMINYFPYDYAAPDSGPVSAADSGADSGADTGPGVGSPAPFLPTITVMDTPWNDGTQLVHIGLQGILPLVEDRPPLNLVFLIDTSGSMADADKLPLLRQSFLLMLDELRPEDEVAIVEYAGSAGVALVPTPASDRAAIAMALMQLGAGGSTNGQGGLEQAYAVAAGMTEDGDVSRVILATDGDFNVGLSGIDELEDFISKKRDTGIYLSVLGFGRGNLDDATMQTLAQNGNGIAAYIDTLNEAQKVLVDQLTGALFAIAGDVKVQVEFNPAVIAEYRLIGYETRALAREDFNNDRVDAGELGAGHAVTAIYEVTPVGSDAVQNDPLRYAPAATGAAPEAQPDDADPAELGFLRLRWKAPGESESQLLETPIYAGATATPGTEAGFATAIAGFGQLLRGDTHLGTWGWDEAIALANVNRGEDPFGYRTEAVQLMRLAESLAGN